jgi:hypothetical protein
MSSSPERDGISTAGSANTKRSKKSKKNITPVSIEDVFNQISIVNASNLNPPPSTVVLTPRSAEACLKLGVNPEIIKVRDIDSFWEHGLDKSVQRMRHEAYIQRRYETMKQLRQERKRIINAEFDAVNTMTSSNQMGMTPEQLLKQQEEASSTLIQLELQRIQKMQKRQEKELQQMIEFEVNRAKVTEEMNIRLEEGKRKEELRKKQQEKRLKLMAEERRLREAQRATQEEIEEQNRRAVMKDMYEKEVQLAEQAAIKAKEQKRFAREMEVEKKRKHEEHRAQTEAYFQEEEARLRKRLEDMQGAEKKKQDAILAKAAEHAAALKKRRAVIEQRIQRNFQMAKLVEEKRKNDFLSKQEHFEQKRTEHLTKLERERALHSQEVELQEQRRQVILMQQRKEEEKKAQSMLHKFEEEEMHVMEVQEIREKEHQIHNEKKNLRTQMKLENVQRTLRVGEYKRLNTLKKIEDVDNRVKSMLDQRQHLVAERRKAANATRLQKEQIAKVMEEIRANATKANKLITASLSGKVSLDSLLGTGSDNSKSRSRSAEKKKKAKSTGELLGIANRNGGSHSADAVDQTSRMMYSQKDADSAARPYVSPYDLPAGPA